MQVRKFLGIATFTAKLNDEYDIIHQFRNLDGGAINRNNPVEFHTVSIKDKRTGKGQYLAQASDEASPCIINGDFIGGNHGQPSAIFVYSPEHKKTIADVGSIYVDDDKTKFTLVRVQNDDYLLLISENVGMNENNYEFKSTISGNLKYISDGKNDNGIKILEQTSKTYLSPALKHKSRKLVGYTNGKARTIESQTECDYAEIIEEYDIINPATVAPALTAERPKDGYSKTLFLSDFGKPMANYKMIYRVLPDGAVVCYFELTKLTDVKLTEFFAVMSQGYINLFGGDKLRYIPKLKPIPANNTFCDFSSPYPLIDAPFPDSIRVAKDLWDNPDSPTDRFIDYATDEKGNFKMGFAMGYLPLFDGAPDIRKNNDYSIFIYRTRKGYPVFKCGNFSHARGIAYKKYFFTKPKSSVYSIEHDKKKYIYFDFFENCTLTYPVSGKITPFEIKNAEYVIEDGNLNVSSKKGFAVFIEE